MPFMAFMENPHVFFQMLKPGKPKGASDRDHTMPAFPDGNIGFMNAI